jgi:hypothetical protein
VVAVGLYAWWATQLQPFTWPSLVAVVGAGLTAMAIASRRRQPRTALPPRPEGIWVWLVLVSLLAVWELLAYVRHPREDNPTLSSLTDQLLDPQPMRAMAFALWLAGAYRLARR